MVWQPPHPYFAMACCPAAGSPGALPGAAGWPAAVGWLAAAGWVGPAAGLAAAAGPAAPSEGAPASIQSLTFCTSVSGTRGPVGGIRELPVAVPSMVESRGLAVRLPGTTTGP